MKGIKREWRWAVVSLSPVYAVSITIAIISYPPKSAIDWIAIASAVITPVALSCMLAVVADRIATIRMGYGGRYLYLDLAGWVAISVLSFCALLHVAVTTAAYFVYGEVLHGFEILGYIAGYSTTIGVLVALRETVFAAPPGGAFLRIAELFVSRSHYERVFLPAVEDMRHEYFVSIANGERWRARVVYGQWCVRLLLTAVAFIYDATFGRLFRKLFGIK